MVSDEELKEHLSQVEYGPLATQVAVRDVEDRIERIDRASKYVHQEFARQGAVLERQEADNRSLAGRLEDIERRLAEVERVLRDGPLVAESG